MSKELHFIVKKIEKEYSDAKHKLSSERILLYSDDFYWGLSVGLKRVLEIIKLESPTTVFQQNQLDSLFSEIKTYLAEATKNHEHDLAYGIYGSSEDLWVIRGKIQAFCDVLYKVVSIYNDLGYKSELGGL